MYCTWRGPPIKYEKLCSNQFWNINLTIYNYPCFVCNPLNCSGYIVITIFFQCLGIPSVYILFHPIVMGRCFGMSIIYVKFFLYIFITEYRNFSITQINQTIIICRIILSYLTFGYTIDYFGLFALKLCSCTLMLFSEEHHQVLKKWMKLKLRKWKVTH